MALKKDEDQLTESGLRGRFYREGKSKRKQLTEEEQLKLAEERKAKQRERHKRYTEKGNFKEKHAEWARTYRANNREHNRTYMAEYMREYRARKKAEKEAAEKQEQQ